MKKIIAALAAVSALAAAAPASAADLAARPVYTKAPAVFTPAYDWTGFYVGVNGGYEFSGTRTTDYFHDPVTGATIANPGSTGAMKGGFGGGQIGYNWEVNNWVVGLESDIDAGGMKSSTTFLCAACLGGANFSQKNDWIGTTRVRAGVLVTPQVLFYVTGGAAYGEIKTTATLFNSTAVSGTFTDKVTKGGWTVGGGIEGMFASNWLARVEYLYADLGTIGTGAQLLAGANAHHDSFETRAYENLIRVGISYKFGGPAPVVAKY